MIPSLMHATPERFRDEFLMTKRYANLRLLYLLYYRLNVLYTSVLWASVRSVMST